MGEEAKYEGMCLLFDGLQQPILNKQVGKLKAVFLEPVHLRPPSGKGSMSPSLSAICFSFVFVFSLLAQLTYVLLDIAIQELFPELNRVNRRSPSFA